MRDDFPGARNERYLPLPRHGCIQDASALMKRTGDFLIACALLAVTLPLLICVALAIRCESRGPVLDRETCQGYDGRRFQMLKFRTVVFDPEGAQPRWARRMTRMGSFLRHTRIESLPQLVNVLRGEMSFVNRDRRSPSFLE